MSSRREKRYRIIVLPRFEKDLAKLEPETRIRVLKGLSTLESAPYSFKELHGSLKGNHTMRTGDYRVIYTIDEKRETVFVMTVTHRRSVYK